MAVVVARLFGAAASGEFFLAFAVVGVAGMVGRLGTDIQAIKSLPSLFHAGRFETLLRELRWLRRYCYAGTLIAGVIVALGGASMCWLNLAPAVGLHLVVLAASIPLASASILESAALRAADRLSLGAFAETGLSQGMTIVLIVGLTSIFGVGPVAISICYTISAAATAVISWVWTRRSIPHEPRSGAEDTVTVSAGVKAAMLHMMGSSVLFFVLTSSPLFVLGIFATAREVGYYNAATRLSTLIALIPALQTTYLIPRVARHLAEHDVASANALLRRAVRQAALLSVAVAVVMLIFAGHFVAIFGNDFAAARPTLIALVIGQALIIFLGNVNPVMAVAGLERRSLLLVILVLALGVIPMLGAASVMGAVGVAMVYVLMSLGYALGCDVLLRTKLGIKCFVN